MSSLDTKLEKTGRIGMIVAKKIKKLGVETVLDLLFYFPSRYEDYSAITPISKILPGTNVNTVAVIELIQSKRSPRRRMHITEALISDESGQAKVIWYNQPFVARALRTGDKISLSGKADSDYSGIVFKSPSYEKINSFQNVHTQGLVPIYPLTANLTQKQIRFVISRIIEKAKEVEEWLPTEILKKQKLLSLSEAIKKIHFPKNGKDISEAKRRLAFNELFLIQLQSQLIKKNSSQVRAEKIIFQEKKTKEFTTALPFKLTNSQKNALGKF
ncbi:MAG: hypothetical protein ABH881_00470 [bacterium]